MSRRLYWQIVAVATVIVLGAAQAGRADEVFVSITPCRVVNTRDVPADGPKLGNRVTRDFTIQGNCGVPVGATAVAINITVTEQEAQGFLSAFRSDLDFGVTAFHSNLNFPAFEFATDNGSIAPLAAATPDLSVYWDSLPSTAPGTFAAHVLIDVFGYFVDDTGGDSGVVASYAARHNQLSTSAGTTSYGPAGASNPTNVQSTLPAAQRIEILSPEAGCTAQNLRVRQVDPTTGDPVVLGADAARTFTLLIDGSPSTLTCTINATESSCLSIATATLAAGGQRLAIQDDNGASGSYPTADALIVWECVSP